MGNWEEFLWNMLWIFMDHNWRKILVKITEMHMQKIIKKQEFSKYKNKKPGENIVIRYFITHTRN
jgi:hypothetical protein